MTKHISTVILLALLVGIFLKSSPGAVELYNKGEKKVKMGWNFQVWGQWAEGQSPDGRHVSTDFFMRRSRLYVNGQFNNWLRFNYQLNMDNDGKASDVNNPKKPDHTEAYLTLTPDEKAMISFGLVKIPFARQNLEGAFSQLLVDKDFTRGKIQVHRGELDYGITLWGSLFVRRVKYYVSVMDGKHGGPNVQDQPRFAARGEIHLLEPDAPTSYEPCGTYFGEKKVLSLGAAYDRVPDAFLIGASTTSYKAWTVDIFFELPVRDSVLTLESAFMVFDHGVQRGTLAPANQGDGFYLQGGYLLSGQWLNGRLQPVFRYSSFNSDRSAAGSDESRYSLGLNYYLKGHNAKAHLDATRLDFSPSDPSNSARQDHWQFSIGIQVKI